MEVSPSEISSSRHSWEDVSGTPSACQLNPEEYNLEEHVNSLLARGMPLFTVSPGRIPKNNFKPAVDYKHKILNYSRKSKSLEELSRKFIMRF